jgi:uncharacterized protein YceK
LQYTVLKGFLNCKGRALNLQENNYRTNKTESLSNTKTNNRKQTRTLSINTIMGNTTSSSSHSQPRTIAARAAQVFDGSVRDLQSHIQGGIQQLEEQDHPAAQLMDTLCSPYLQTRKSENDSDDDYDEEDDDVQQQASYATTSLDDTARAAPSSGSDNAPVVAKTRAKKATQPAATPPAPVTSSTIRRCYFTNTSIGPQTQQYEGLTLHGSVVYMLAAAMKLKGCPTICDEDLRRVELAYTQKFAALPNELVLSSGWRRISKYCHFSGRAIPDGVPFFRE